MINKKICINTTTLKLIYVRESDTHKYSYYAASYIHNSPKDIHTFCYFVTLGEIQYSVDNCKLMVSVLSVEYDPIIIMFICIKPLNR